MTLHRATYDPQNLEGSPDVVLAKSYLPRDSVESIASHIDDPDQAVYADGDGGKIGRLFLNREQERGRVLWLYPTGINIRDLFIVVGSCVLDLSERFPEIADWPFEGFTPDGTTLRGQPDGGQRFMARWMAFLNRGNTDNTFIETRDGIAYLQWTFAAARRRILAIGAPWWPVA